MLGMTENSESAKEIQENSEKFRKFRECQGASDKDTAQLETHWHAIICDKAWIKKL